MRPKYDIYSNLGYWFLSLIVLVFFGFNVTYFFVISQPKPALIHIHFALMALWVLMLIVQPFLIKYKKTKWHNLVGKTSYFLVPLVLFTSFLVIRQEYYGNIYELTSAVAPALTDAEITQKAAEQPIALIYFTWFTLFYILAIVNRHRSLIHSRYMLATALTLVGPTVDRILGIHFGIETLFGFIPAFIISFLLNDILLLYLLYQDSKNKMPIKTLATCLIIYIGGQVLYFAVPLMDWWPSLVALIMKPAP